MKEIFYEWVRNIVFYQLLTSIIMNMIPNDAYRKYVRFFMGMLFIVIAIQPMMQVFGLASQMDADYVQEMIEQELKENNFEFDMEGLQGNDGKGEKSDRRNEEG